MDMKFDISFIFQFTIALACLLFVDYQRAEWRLFSCGGCNMCSLIMNTFVVHWFDDLILGYHILLEDCLQLEYRIMCHSSSLLIYRPVFMVKIVVNCTFTLKLASMFAVFKWLMIFICSRYFEKCFLAVDRHFNHIVSGILYSSFIAKLRNA